MLIAHIGHSKFHTPQHTLDLKNILHVPKASRHLLPIYKFSKDNNAFFEFHPGYFFVKDRTTKIVLLQGQCEGGLYPLLPSQVPVLKSTFSCVKPTEDRWHYRLGHPSSSIIQHVLLHNNLPCSGNSNKTTVCDACEKGKSHQLPYYSSNNMSFSPLELVYSDV